MPYKYYKLDEPAIAVYEEAEKDAREILEKRKEEFDKRGVTEHYTTGGAKNIAAVNFPDGKVPKGFIRHGFCDGWRPHRTWKCVKEWRDLFDSLQFPIHPSTAAAEFMKLPQALSTPVEPMMYAGTVVNRNGVDGILVAKVPFSYLSEDEDESSDDEKYEYSKKLEEIPYWQIVKWEEEKKQNAEKKS